MLKRKSPIKRKPAEKAEKSAPSKRGTNGIAKPVKSIQAIRNAEARGVKLTVGQLHKLCHAEWSKLVKLHANGICEWCGLPAVHAHHMRAKAQGNKLKYVVENGVALCYGCHVEFHQKDSWKGWSLFMRQRPESFEIVTNTDKCAVKYMAHDLQEILDSLREQVAQFREAA